MNTSVKKRYYIIPVFYVSLIFLLFFVGFNRSSKTFSIKEGPLAVSGSGQEGLDKNSVKSLTVDIPGLKMNLTKNPPYLLDGSGNRTYIRVTGFSFESNKLTVSFTGSIRLTIDADAGKNEPRVVDAFLSVPSNTGKYLSVYLPAQAGYTMTRLSFLPSYTFNEGGVEKLYVFGSGSIFDVTAGVLQLPVKNGGADFSLYNTGKSEALSFYFFGSKGPAKRSAYEAAVETFLHNGYSGWKDGRVTALKGKGSFSNAVVTAYIAESLKRGRYSDIPKVISKISKYSDKFSFLSAPLIGNIVTTDEKRTKSDDRLKKQMTSGQNRDDVFLYPHLIEELNWISSSALYRTFNELVSSLDLSAHIAPKLVTGMVAVYRDIISGSSKQYENLSKLYAVIESVLYPDLVRTGRGLFLRDDSGRLNVRLSLKAGKALYDIGQINNDTLMSSIGKTLVVSSLNLQKKEGWLPSYLGRDGSPEGSGGFYGAEIFYSDLTDNEFYPHLVVFNGGTSREIRIWTAARDITLQRGSHSLTFTVTFPRGISHHLVIKGIPPFNKLEMHGIPWNSDRRFQYYTSGWVYNERDKTLYMKLNQRKNREQIIIRTTGN